MGVGLLSHARRGAGDAEAREAATAERRSRARRWLEGSIAAWEQDGRITETEAARLRCELDEPSVLAVLPHFGIHLAIGAVLRFPFGSIVRVCYVLFNLLLATVRLLARAIDRRAWRQAFSIHSPLVILFAGLPGVGTFSYLAARPVRTHHLLLRVGLDAVLLKLPLRVYERLGLRWVVARPSAAEVAALDEQRTPFRTTLWAQEVVLILGCIVVALTGAHFAAQVALALGLIERDAMGWEYVVRWTNLDAEASFGTWFTTLLHLLLMTLLWAIAYTKRREGDRFARHWLVLAALPLGFSLDEIAKLHDAGGSNIAELRDRLGFSGIFYYSWVLFAVPCVILVALYFRRFILSLPRATRFFYFLAAGLFVAGELAFEMVSAAYVSTYDRKDFFYGVIVTIEEGMAMAGIFVAIAATLHYIQTTYGELRFSLSEELPAATLAGGTASAFGAGRPSASEPAPASAPAAVPRPAAAVGSPGPGSSP